MTFVSMERYFVGVCVLASRAELPKCRQKLNPLFVPTS